MSIFVSLPLLVACLAGCNSEKPVQEQNVSFDSSRTGALPDGFSTALTGGGGPIAWVVRDDPQLGTGRKVLVQESADDTSYRFPMCIYEHSAARDVAAEVKFRSITGKTDQAAGIVLRYSPENYYIARANALEDNVNLFKTVDGKRSKIVEVDAKVTPGEWHTLRFEAKGSHLTVIFDGKTIIQADDTTFGEPGKIGLWTKADSVTAFRDFKIGPAH